MYRGKAIPALYGAYLFGDFCAGIVRAFLPSNPSGTHRSLRVTVSSLASFGQDADGELYVLSLDGPVYRIDPA